MYVTVPMERA